MAVSVRQNYLFAAEDYKIAYESFTNANFKSYDYDGIRDALISYVKTNYAENFNDWIESSEFMAILDLIAYIGHSYAFRVDLDSRENFLATAEGRQNVLRLARQLGYTPTRSISAQGLLKINSIKTNQTVYNSDNVNLSGKTIFWNDLNDPDSYYNFITILNEMLQGSNQFGEPYKSGSIDGILTQLYFVNSDLNLDSITKKFTQTVGGISSDFEIVNSNFVDSKYFYESVPNQNLNFNLIYRNDSNGFSSSDTGFFVLFKQGNLNYVDYLIDDPIENRVIDVDVLNINQDDVWVQNIASDGTIIQNWTKVDNLNGHSVIYNNIQKGIRHIYQVITADDDSISIKFADGQYGEIPKNLIRIWYRTSNNSTYNINPSDIQNIKFNIPYIGTDGNSYIAVVSASLEYTVRNASATENLDSIKFNAPLVYATQKRMITDQDYSVYPLSVNSSVVKVKAINRTHSGHSRYFNLYDPTGIYDNLNIFGQDGYIYKEYLSRRKVLPSSEKNLGVLQTLQDLIEDANSVHFYYDKYQFNQLDVFNTNLNGICWRSISVTNNSSTGYFSDISSNYNDNVKIIDIAKSLGIYGLTINYQQIKIGSVIEFTLPLSFDELDSQWVQSNRETIYAKVIRVQNKGLGVYDTVYNYPTGKDRLGNGVVTLSQNIPDGARISKIIPPIPSILTNITEEIFSQLTLKNTFGLYYNLNLQTWNVINADNVSNKKENFDLSTSGLAANQDSSWMLRIEYNQNSWEILIRQLRYVFGSETDVRFFNQNFNQILEKTTKKPKKDTIKILAVNNKANVNEFLNTDYYFNPINYFLHDDGYTDPTKIIVTPADANLDLIPDNPFSFEEIVDDQTIYLRQEEKNGYTFDYISNQITDNMKLGRSNIKFVWNHYVEDENKLDPSPSNIIDMLVLTRNYDLQYRNWLKNDGKNYTKPLEPSSLEISNLLKNIEEVKATSDLIIYKSGSYRPLFGAQADLELQANIKTVKIPGADYSDNEVKTLIIENINNYFSINNWDFGETFYWTELSGYLHQQLSGIIATAVIVPVNESSSFGKLFQITAEPNEFFINCATINNVFIVDSINDLILRT